MGVDVASTSQLDQLRSRIQTLSDQATHERDGLKAERDQLTHERDGLKAERDQLTEALLHLFPYAIYRDKRPDLAGKNDQDIAIHFVRHGIREAVSLDATSISDTLKILQEENQALLAKQNEQEAFITDYASRLSALQDLFIKLSLEGVKT